MPASPSPATICSAIRLSPPDGACVYGYPASAGAAAILDSLRTSSSPWSIPTKSLALGLRILSGGFARVDAGAVRRDGDYFLLVDRPLTPVQLETVLLAWEQAVRQQFSLPTPSGMPTLAALMRETQPQELHLRDHITCAADSVPSAQRWVFTAAAWYAARRLQEEPLVLDSRKVRLRAVATAATARDVRLLTWDDLLSTERRGRRESAMHYVDARILTVAGITDLVVALRAGTTALCRHWPSVKNVTLDRGDGGLLVELPVIWRGGRRRYEDAAAEVVAALGLAPLPQLTDDALDTDPGLLRARFAKPTRFFAIGDGAGVRFVDRLARHAACSLDAEPLRLVPLRHRFPRRRTDTTTPAALAISIKERQARMLRLLVLYADPDLRTRVLAAINESLVPEPKRPLEPVDGREVQIPLSRECRLALRAAHVPWLLTEGQQQHRARQLEQLLGEWRLRRNGAALTAALCETDSERFTANGSHPGDPKPQLRRLLAGLGVMTQFISPASAPKRAGARDHAALASVRDLLQTAGLFGDRYDAVIDGRLPAGAYLVGLACAEVRTPRGHVLTLTALRVREGGGFDEVLGWLPGDGWIDLPDAMTKLHSRPLVPERLARADGKAAVRALAHAALAALPAAAPVIVFAAAPRDIWPGLTDRSLGRGQLPGDPDAGAPRNDLHVVRVTPPTTGLVITPAAVDFDGGMRNGSTRTRLTRRLHRLESDYDGRGYWLVNQSGHLGRKGAKEASLDRYALLLDDRFGQRELATPWHGLTATEFVVLRAPTLTNDDVAVLAARLCDQAPAWDRRISLPTPAHLAQRMRMEHPDLIALDDGNL